jgi:hypothetical protein
MYNYFFRRPLSISLGSLWFHIVTVFFIKVLTVPNSSSFFVDNHYHKKEDNKIHFRQSSGLFLKIPIKVRQTAWQSGKGRKLKRQLQARAPGGFRKPQYNPESIRDTTGTAGTFKFCRARPHGIPRVEGSKSCLPDAQYVRCRGRDRNP